MGFISPNYTQIPNDFFETYLPQLEKAELKIMLIIMRGTFGYHREEVTISIRDMARQTGLSVASIMPAAEHLEELGLIERITDGAKSTHWRALVENTVSINSTRKKRGVPTIDTPVYQPLVQNVSTIDTQLGLNKDKEKEINTQSQPQPPHEQTPPRNIYTLYSDNIGMLTAISSDQLADYADLPYTMLERAFTEAVNNNVRRWSYVRAILDKWKVSGYQERPAKQIDYQPIQELTGMAPEELQGTRWQKKTKKLLENLNS